MLDLWRERARLARGRPFQAEQDISRGTVDSILSATFGFEVGSIKSQVKILSKINKIALSTNVDVPATFPTASDPQEFTSISKLVDCVEIALNSPIPKQHLTFALKFFPSLVSARKYKDKMIGDRIQTAWKKFCDNADQDDKVKSAVDLLVQREVQIAKKENRAVIYDTQAIRDELFGFIQAGHETSSTTLCWAVKYLTKYQKAQRTLRSALKLAHKRAAEAGELPTAQEIVKAKVPYLDAFIEENHRCGNTVPAIVRVSTRDTVVLGHQIPKGTDVFMMTNGPSFQTREFAVDEPMRSKSSQDSKDRYGVWNASDIEEFVPERWLVKDGMGSLRFDPHAGPALPFGTGLRGCFGRYYLS
jgi:cytochrome P450